MSKKLTKGGLRLRVKSMAANFFYGTTYYYIIMDKEA